jgi:CheY-like chemotaxis protein
MSVIRKILIVEDDDMQRKALAMALERHGFQVSVSQNGQDGVDQANKNPPDLIVMDCLMPKMTGPEALKILKQREQSTKIPVIMTSSTENYNGCCFLKKPFQISCLISLIKEFEQAFCI